MAYVESQRLRETFERVRVRITERKMGSVEWGRAWLAVVRELDIPSALVDAKRVAQDPNSSTNDAAEANRIARWLRRGLAYATRVDEIERDWRGLYPIDVAQDRLAGMSAGELFDLYAHRYESEQEARAALQPIPAHSQGEPIAITLERSMMRNRVSNPDLSKILRVEHARVRRLFPELEVA